MDLILVSPVLDSSREGTALRQGGEKSVAKKICLKCKQTLDLSAFGKQGDRLASRCKKCAAEWIRIYRLKNPEIAKATRLAFRQRHSVQRLAYRAELKTCNRCQDSLPVSMFGKDAWTSDGLRHLCLRCINAKRQEAHSQDPSKRVREAQTARALRKRDPERYKQIHKEYCDRHPEARKETIRRSHRKRAAKNLEYGRRRIALLKGNSVGVVDYEAILSRDGDVCYLCGEKPKKRHFDHVIPLARGGAHSMENIRVACATCNLKKGARLLAA